MATDTHRLIVKSDRTVRGIAVGRPEWIRGAEAGRQELGGWIDSEGRFYPAPSWGHEEIARLLRLTGAGPTERWDMTDGWIMVKAHGEAFCLPFRISQRQYDSLGDMLTHVPAGSYYRNLLESLRAIREQELASS